MANLVSRASGNLTDASTWKTVETGTRAVQSTHSASTNTTTSDVYNADAQDITIANLSVIEGILLFCNQTTSTGTVTVTLSADSGTTATKTLVVNATDLPLYPSWVFFKFATTLTGDGGTDYAIGIKGSSAGNATFFRDGTTANWTHLIVTDQNPASVAAGDVFFIVGEQTGAATENAFTVTMNSTATTDYGTGTDGAENNGVEIGNIGTLAYGTTAATNYYLKLSGSLNVWGDGTFNKGTTGTPIPRDSTAVLEFDPVADGGMGLLVQNGGTYTDQGLSRTSGKNIVKCKLTADTAAAGTGFTVDTDTGWLNGDVFCIGKTQRSSNQESEALTLSGAAGASSITSTAGVTYAKKGTGILSADLGLLTRNSIVRSATSTIMAYVNFKTASTVDLDWVEFYYLGENATGKKGMEVDTTSAGSFSMNYCSLHDCEDFGLVINGATASHTISDNVFYNLNSALSAGVTISGIIFEATSGAHTITNNIMMRIQGGNNGTQSIRLSDVGSVFTGNLINDCRNSGFSLAICEGGVINSIQNNVVSCSMVSSTVGIQIGTSTFGATGINGTFGANSCIMNNGPGLAILQVMAVITFNSWIIAGNLTAGIDVTGAAGFTATFNSCTIAGSTGFTTTSGIRMTGSSGFTFNSCSFGVVTGNYIANTQDVLCTGSYVDYLYNNCLFGSATLISSYTSMLAGSIVKFNKYNQTDNSHRWYTKYGQGMSTGAGLSDTTVRTASSLGLRIAPEDATTGFTYTFKVLAKANSVVSVSGFIKKNAAFSTDDVIVELYLPTSTTADATYTMPDDTSWNAFAIGASYSGSIDLYATVKIIGKTTTASAYLYVDDLYNGTNHITAFDVWENAQPSPIMFEQLGDASAVWAVLTSTQTTSGTMGYFVTKLLSVAKFLGLK